MVTEDKQDKEVGMGFQSSFENMCCALAREFSSKRFSCVLRIPILACSFTGQTIPL